MVLSWTDGCGTRGARIFAPRTDFTPGAGLWGMQGIIEHQPGDFVVFVTFGNKGSINSMKESRQMVC